MLSLWWCVSCRFDEVRCASTTPNYCPTHLISAEAPYTEPLRTYTILTLTELARCVGCFCTRAGWFKHVEPHRTYTNHTITELARCVGCLCTRSGGSSTSNLHEPLQHRASKVCRVLLHEFGVVQAQRTNTNHSLTELARCVGCFCTRAGWFKHSEPHRTSRNSPAQS